MRAAALVALLVPILLATWSVALRGGFPDAAGCVALGVAGVAWLAACGLGAHACPSRPTLLWIVAGAVALRAPLLVADLELSDDVHRYVWEGALVLDGTSPYAHAPDAPELAPHREAWPDVHARMNNTSISAAYPPVAQAAFAAVVAGFAEEGDADRAVLGMRLFFTACDLAVLFGLLGLLRARGGSPAAAVAWAWSPLVALAFAGSGHFDSLGIALLVLGLLGLSSRRGEAGGASLVALGALVKLLPAVALAFAVRRSRRPLVLVGAALGVVALACAPLLVLEGGTSGLLRGVSEYGLRWESTSLVYRWIEPPLRDLLAGGAGATDPRRVARGMVVAAWLGVALVAWLRRVEPVAATFACLGAFLALSPTLHPWYVTWIVPFLALDLRGVWAFRLLAAVAPLLYWPVAGWRARGVWEEPAWLWPLVALPFLAALVVELAQRRRAAGGAQVR